MQEVHYGIALCCSTLCVPISALYPGALTRPEIVGTNTVCQMMCVICLSKLSRQELQRDMTLDKSAGWKPLNSLSSLSDTEQSV